MYVFNPKIKKHEVYNHFICYERIVRQFQNIQTPMKNIIKVTNLTNEFIEYSIDSVRYKTFTYDGLTTYSVTKLKESFENQPVIWNADSVFIDIKKTLNAIGYGILF